jgi:hypothetical protein
MMLDKTFYRYSGIHGAVPSPCPCRLSVSVRVCVHGPLGDRVYKCQTVQHPISPVLE